MLKLCIFITKHGNKTKFKPDLIDFLPILTHTHTQSAGNYLFCHHLILLFSKQHILPKIQIKKSYNSKTAGIASGCYGIKGNPFTFSLCWFLLTKSTATPLSPAGQVSACTTDISCQYFTFVPQESDLQEQMCQLFKINNSIVYNNL